jgi:hypothetical protein
VRNVREEVRAMNNNQLITSKKNEFKDGENGYKIIEFNVSDPTESLFAVVTPIKKQ